ncbi:MULTISPECIES: Fic family protein [unclassified Pseudomonas]|jgi:cell filamentation protein|uniref:Fic/DOC family protein n=1 Tax=unclassified Pseudomonas TaxID=196821 RepID=UPI000C2F9DB3|nr:MULTISPECIES: Fic family protein [unclassified Pseudomonas]MCU1740294.1 Fic family protein [Pseudomonas sp. 20S_6.2_Bac1]
MVDKYGAGQDPYCYPGTDALRNRLDIRDEQTLNDAEQAIYEIAAASRITLSPPPYDLAFLQRIHQTLFSELYEWAGQLRTVKIQKAETMFCTPERIVPEAAKIFRAMEDAGWFEDLSRADLIVEVAQAYGDLNVIHPFREGNGRAQRILFENIIVNTGFTVDWWVVKEASWIPANISAVMCDYRGLEVIFDQCISEMPQKS